MEEIRKDIVWYEWLYQVSDLWRIKSLSRWKINSAKGGYMSKEKILKPEIVKGYCRVYLYKNKTFIRPMCHVLKAIVFIPNPENKPEVNHRDGNRSNNGYHVDGNDNLEWCTTSENILHSYRVLFRKKSQAWLWKFWKYHNWSKRICQFTLDNKLVK